MDQHFARCARVFCRVLIVVIVGGHGQAAAQSSPPARATVSCVPVAATAALRRLITSRDAQALATSLGVALTIDNACSDFSGLGDAALACMSSVPDGFQVDFDATQPDVGECHVRVRALVDGDTALYVVEAMGTGGGEALFLALASRPVRGGRWIHLCTNFFPGTASICGEEGPSGMVAAGCVVPDTTLASLPVPLRLAACGGMPADGTTATVGPSAREPVPTAPPSPPAVPTGPSVGTQPISLFDVNRLVFDDEGNVVGYDGPRVAVWAPTPGVQVRLRFEYRDDGEVAVVATGPLGDFELGSGPTGDGMESGVRVSAPAQGRLLLVWWSQFSSGDEVRDEVSFQWDIALGTVVRVANPPSTYVDSA